MSNELMRFDAGEFGVMQSMAKSMVDSGFFSDTKQVAQAMVKIQAGRELGLPPFASMTGIHIVQGKPVLGANLIATLVKNSGRYDYRIKALDNQSCVLEWYENGKPVGEAGFTMAEANAAGLTNKPTWKAYPSDMLFARALTRGARRYAPGIFGGSPIYTPDELGVETDEDGAIIQGEVITVSAPTTPTGRTYADGSPVAESAAETYDAYVAAHDGNPPRNVHNLRAWYKVQRNGNGGAAEQPALPVDDPDADEAALATARGDLD